MVLEIQDTDASKKKATKYALIAVAIIVSLIGIKGVVTYLQRAKYRAEYKPNNPMNVEDFKNRRIEQKRKFFASSKCVSFNGWVKVYSIPIFCKNYELQFSDTLDDIVKMMTNPIGICVSRQQYNEVMARYKSKKGKARVCLGFFRGEDHDKYNLLGLKFKWKQ